MKKFEEANNMEHNRISDDELDLITGAGVSGEVKTRNTATRKEKSGDFDVVLLPMTPGFGTNRDNGRQEENPPVIRL